MGDKTRIVISPFNRLISRLGCLHETKIFVKPINISNTLAYRRKLQFVTYILSNQSLTFETAAKITMQPETAMPAGRH